MHDEWRTPSDYGMIVYGSLYQDHRLTIGVCPGNLHDGADGNSICPTRLSQIINMTWRRSRKLLRRLLEPNHSPRYYELLDRVLPDWRERREKLNAFEFG
jgi:hypothetical protein